MGRKVFQCRKNLKFLDELKGERTDQAYLSSLYQAQRMSLPAKDKKGRKGSGDTEKETVCRCRITVQPQGATIRQRSTTHHSISVERGTDLPLVSSGVHNPAWLILFYQARFCSVLYMYCRLLHSFFRLRFATVTGLYKSIVVDPGEPL